MEISFEDKLFIFIFAVIMFGYVFFINHRDAKLLRHCDNNPSCYSYLD